MGSSPAKITTRIGLGLALTLLLTATGFAFPSARSYSRAVYDPNSSRIILFGGVGPMDANSVRHSFDDTWAWTGRRWVQLFPKHAPSRRSGHILVYDSNRKQPFLFGGGDANGNYNDSWVFRNGDWVPVATPNAPTPRRNSSAAFDPERDRTILYGGFDKTTTFHDTWQFDGTTWTRAVESGPVLDYSTMVFDAARHQTLLIGETPERVVEMYRWSGTAWEKLTPATLPPCVRNGGMVYQTHNSKVLFTGGSCITGPVNTTFEWDGSNWTNVATSGSPGTVSAFALAYDEVRQETILFGGIDFAERSLTLGYRNGTWASRGMLLEPGPRSLFVFEAIPQKNAVYLFGGQNDPIDLLDLWKYQNGRWQPLAPGGGPTACGSPVGAFDESRGRLVVLCAGGDTWEFDGDHWTAFTALTEKPINRRFQSAVYDAENKRVTVFGGYDSGNYLRDTWTWNGTSWTRYNDKNSSPPARMLATLFFDPVQKKVMMYGGIGRPTRDDRIIRYDDMWSFDGHAWTKMTPATNPGSRYGARARLNPLTGHVLMFGGKNSEEQYTNDQWEWNGTDWARLTTATTPEGRMNGGLAIDPSTNQLVYYGGYAGGYFSELWTLGPDGWKIVEPENGHGRPISRSFVAAHSLLELR